MCGIFGVFSPARRLPPVPLLCRATDLLRHRGPDGGGYWTEPDVFFGHRRLAIIDLHGGFQPMASADARFVITFNGEIYNYPELREELRQRGAQFQTSSDTEVILAGYAQWGPGVVERLEGMFAFALFDRRERTMLLARDRCGEKPLLLADSAEGVVFASELAPIAALGAGGQELEEEALGGYLCLNYVPGDRTLLRGVRRLPAAHWRLYRPDGTCGEERYWSPAAAAPARSEAPVGALLDELQGHLDHAVRLTLRSDVPVGLFLSGGVDSSVVAESAARAGRLAAAFCVDFADQGFSEWPLASRTARQLGLELVRVPLDASVLGEFLDVAAHLDDPLADSSAMAVWTVARAAAGRLKVVLSGDGGDEAFGGYLTYQASALHARLRGVLPAPIARALAAAGGRLPIDTRTKVGTTYKLHRFLRGLPLPTSVAHFTWNGTWLPAQAAALAAGPYKSGAGTALERLVARHHLPARPSLRDLQVVDLQEYLTNDILAKVDRATMAHGLESRAPLLNPALVQFALSLPEPLRVDGRLGKVLLRRLCARHFGEAHAHAPKQGFSLPIQSWLREGGRTMMTSLLARDRVAALGVLDAGEVERVVREHLDGAAHGWELWGLMVLVAWHDCRVASPPDVRRRPDPADMAPLALTSAAV